MKQDTVLLKVKLVQRNKKISNAKQQNCEQVTFPSSCAVILRSIDVPLDLSTNSACHFICSNLSGNDLEILGINNIGEFFANNSNCIGLLREGDNNSKSRWIEDDKKLRDAGLLDNEMVELRKRKISLKINFSDNHFVEDKVNVAQNVEEYLSKICLEKGIGNFDEYGFCILPKSSTCDKKDKKHLDETLSRSRGSSLIWLNPAHNLSDYDLVENVSTLYFKRRYFFSDRNVDKCDPIQLNFLYCHCKDEVLNGNYRCTAEQIVQLTALQCQIDFGDFNSYNSGNLRLKERLPNEYSNNRGMDKKIMNSYSSLIGTSDLDAKMNYVRECQKLSTYGYSFFLVKEKVKGKRKLISRILGISKDSVARIDLKSNMIIQSWPLTHIKRWGSSNVTFTLDLGDYADSFYTVQTDKGSEMGELISGYIRITLKKKRTVAQSVNEPKSMEFIEEVIQQPQKEAIVRETLPKPIKFVAESSCDHKVPNQDVCDSILPSNPRLLKADPPPIQQSTADFMFATSDGTKNQSTFYTFHDILSIVKGLLGETRKLLECRCSTPKAFSSNDYNCHTQKQYALSRLCSAAAECARLAFSYLDKDDPQWTLCVGVSVFIAAINVRDLVCDIAGNSLLMVNNEDCLSMLDQLFCNFDQLIGNMITSETAVENSQKVISSAGDVGYCCLEIYQRITRNDESQISNMIPQAKAVAADVATLVMQARQLVISSPSDIIPAATRCTLYASQLVAVVKASELVKCSKRSRDLVLKCIDRLDIAVEEMANICCQLDREAYTCVKDTLALLKEVINQNQYQSDPLSCDAQSSLQILLTSIENTLLASSSDQPLVRIHANDTNEATNNLLCVVKQQLDQYRESAGLQQNLLKSDYDALINASIQFKNATNAFNGILSDNDDLIFACDNLSAASVRAANWSLSRPVLREADKCINEAINAAIQVVAAANAWHPDIQGEIIHKNIILLNEIVPELIAALVHSDQIDSLPQRIHLVFIADDFHTRCTSLLCDIVHFKTTINSITDQFAIGRLWSSLDDLKLVLSELQIQIHRIAELYCPSFSTDLLRTIRALNRDLDLNEFYSIPKTQSITCKVDQYTLCFRFVVSSISNICNVSISKRSSGNVLARNCKQLCQHLVDLVRVVRRLTIPVSNYGEDEFHIDVKSRNFLIQNTKSLLEISFLLLCAVGNLLSWNESALTLRNRFQFCNNTPVELFKETENKVIQIFQESLSVLPCFVEISDASRQLSDSANRILAQRLPLISLPSILPYNNCVVLLCEINHHINSVCYSALSVCLGLRLGVNCLVRAIKEFVQSFEMLMEFAMKFVVYLASQVSVRKYLLLLRKIHNAAVFFVETAQRHSFSLLDENGNDDNDFIANQQSSHRQLVRKLCELTFMILSVAPGRSLYDYTTSRLRYARELSFKIVSPVNNMNLVESNGQLIQHSKELGEFVSKIAQAAKNKQPVVESVSECIQTAASAALGLVESSTQAAYLIAISPNQSGQPEGQPSVFDQVVFVKSREAIIAALHAFTDPSNSQFEAHLTTAVEFSIILSNAARDAACRVNANEAASSYFLQRSQEIATELCDLVQLSLRDANNWLNSETREHVQRLELVVEAIFMYATSKKFCVIPSPITLQGREAQRPIVVSICQVIDGTIGLIESLHDLSDGSQQDDRTSWQQLSNHTHNISDGIKSLIVGIRGSVPGDQVCQFALNQLRQLINITQGSSHISCSTELTNIDFDRRKDTMSQYVDAMIYDTMCLGDLLEQISSSSKTLSNTSDLSEEGIIGHLISQFVIAEESLLHNVLCLAKIEMMPRSQILINKAIDSSEMAFKFISTVKEHFAFNNSSNMNDQIVKYKERCREINDELLSDIIKIADNCFSTKGNLKKSQKENKSNAPRTSTPINSVEYCQTNSTTTTPKLSTERVTFPLEVEQPNSHDPLINTNVYDTARSLIENTRSLVLRCSVPAEASQPVMDAIERLTAILSLEDESKNVSDQEPLLKAVRDVSDALSTLIKDVGSRSELLSTSDLDLLKQATQTSILHRG